MGRIKQVILYRRDLNMRKGKIAAQIAHASMKVFFDRGEVRKELIRVCHFEPVAREDYRYHLHIPLDLDMEHWVTGTFDKVVLSVEGEKELLVARDLAAKAELPWALIEDHGHTEFHGVHTKTALAIGPARAEDIDLITGPEGQVETKLA